MPLCGRGASLGQVSGSDNVREWQQQEKLEEFLAEPRNIMVAGIRRDGRPHLSPNWFYWDGQLFYVSTTRDRVKYAIFQRDPRAQLAIDDSTGFRAVLVPATVEVREDIAAELSGSAPSGKSTRRAVPDDERPAGPDSGGACPAGHHT